MPVPRAGLSADGVVRTALEIVDEQGPEALTLATLAARAGVATPSLYKHVGSLSDLRTRVAARVLTEMTEVATAAVLGRSGDDAVAAVMRGMRGYALDHPKRYAAIPPDPVHDPALAEPARRLLDVFFAVLRVYNLDGSAAVHATRCLRVIFHGFASIESAGGFGLAEDPGDTYEQLIDLLITYLRRA